MAIWQVNLNFKIQKKLNFFDTDFNNSLQALSNVLPETTSWSDSIKQYGLLDSTCIEILLDESNHVEEITLRLDLINFSLHQLECICEFAVYNNFLMEYENEFLAENPGYRMITKKIKIVCIKAKKMEMYFFFIFKLLFFVEGMAPTPFRAFEIFLFIKTGGNINWSININFFTCFKLSTK